MTIANDSLSNLVGFNKLTPDLFSHLADIRMKSKYHVIFDTVFHVTLTLFFIMPLCVLYFQLADPPDLHGLADFSKRIGNIQYLNSYSFFLNNRESENELLEWVPAALGSVNRACCAICLKQTSSNEIC